MMKKNHIHINGFVLCISLEQRLEATRKWSIVMTLPSFKSRGAGYESVCFGINNTRSLVPVRPILNKIQLLINMKIYKRCTDLRTHRPDSYIFLSKFWRF